MTFPHTLTGRLRSSFVVKILKDGEVVADTAYDITESPAYCYTLTFENDGTDYSTWTCVVSDPLLTGVYFVETWEVRKKTVELNVKQIRSRQDSEGGFFKSSYDKEV